MANMQGTNPSSDPAAPGTQGADPAALKDGPAEKGKGGDAGDQVPQSWEDIFKHPRFKELTQTNQTLKDQLSAHEKERQEAAAKLEAEEEAKLKEANQFKELADKNAAKLEAARQELKAIQAQAAKFEAIAAAEVEAQLKALPAPITKLLTPLMEGKTAVDRLEILKAQADTIAALMPQEGDGPNKPPRGVPPTPPGADTQKVAQADEAAYRKTYRAQIKQGL